MTTSNLQRAFLAGAFGLVALTTVAAAQPGPMPPTDVPDVNPVFRGGGSLVVTLAVGALLVGLAPDYTRRVLSLARDEPVVDWVVGFGVGLAGAIVIFVTAITIIGLVVAIPLAIVLGILGLIGSVLGYVFVGTLIGEAADIDGLWPALVIGALLNAVLSAIPVFNGLAGLIIPPLGLGAVLRRWWLDRQS
ncbi:hypothetical protein ACFQH6_10060 [Halobacteriaceae archaeon GCM10025711]